MKLVGLNHDMYIASAALLEDGEITAAVAEERLNREKFYRNFPVQALRYCLDVGDCAVEDIDYFVSTWNPGTYFQKYNPLISGKRRWMAEHLYAVPDHVISLVSNKEKQADYILQTVKIDDADVRFYYITHHRAHAANAFFLSPFDEAAILTADAQGEIESTTLAIGRGNQIEVLRCIDYPQSLGAYYATFTEYLGFQPNSDEWKVMALAAYSSADDKYYRIIRDEMVELLADGTYRFNLNYFQGFLHDRPKFFTPKFVELFGQSRMPHEPIEDHHYAIASAMQRVAEEITFHMMHWLHKETKQSNLAVSGGFFMNSVLNGKIISNTPFTDLFISSCPDDSGNAIGGPLYVYNHILGHEQRPVLTHNYFGPEFSNDEIEKALSLGGVLGERSDNICADTADLINRGLLIGWFQGRMEFGQRALGNRSILADPRGADTKDKINAAIKFREGFRPFAPAVLEGRADEYFELGPDTRVPFMEAVYPVRKDKQAALPAVTHEDGSGRVQTVDQKTNPSFYKLIEEFDKLTGIPILLNTSFNLNGEPIVCSPSDAIRAFFSCGLDVLVMGDYIVRKS